MSARVFVHPHCIKNQEAGQILAEFLEASGYHMGLLTVYQPQSTRRLKAHELVRDLGAVEDTGAYDCPPTPPGHLYERMNGERFLDPRP